MQLKSYLKDYHEFSGKASDISRQLAFAALAIIWIFKGEGTQKLIIPSLLVKSGAYISVALLLDFLQYVISSIIWKTFHAYHEKKGVSADKEIKASEWLAVPGWICYFGKLVFVLIGYSFLLQFLFSRF